MSLEAEFAPVPESVSTRDEFWVEELEKLSQILANPQRAKTAPRPSVDNFRTMGLIQGV
jgi:hypothetical protein